VGFVDSGENPCWGEPLLARCCTRATNKRLTADMMCLLKKYVTTGIFHLGIGDVGCSGSGSDHPP
jgi:hypothetical protein